MCAWQYVHSFLIRISNQKAEQSNEVSLCSETNLALMTSLRKPLDINATRPIIHPFTTSVTDRNGVGFSF